MCDKPAFVPIILARCNILYLAIMAHPFNQTESGTAEDRRRPVKWNIGQSGIIGSFRESPALFIALISD
jgi:hypothetical protein